MHALVVVAALGATSSCNPVGEARPPARVVQVVAPPKPAPEAAPTPAAPETPPAEGEDTIDTGPRPSEGTYASAACGDRTYARIVMLDAGGAITIEDRVSPCPPGSRCVWSGVVTRTGTYHLDTSSALGKPIQLVLSVPQGDSPLVRPLPPHLLWWDSRGVMTETDATCEYTRAL